MSLTVNVAFVALCAWQFGQSSVFAIGMIAYAASRNLLFSLGLKKPFIVKNEELERQKGQADIVFSGLNGQVPIKFVSKLGTCLAISKFIIEAIFIFVVLYMA